MYDAIIIGARCAGSPTTFLLARKGYKVLLLDKAGFPSDTISTHYIHQSGVARLHRWGLLDRLAATRCPPIGHQIFDVGPFAITASPYPADGITMGYAPRRTVLDKLLIDTARESGAEVREHFTVEEVVMNAGRVTGVRGRAQGGDLVEEEARMVIGADGMRSMVAKAVGAPMYNEHPAASFAYYSYWSNVKTDAAELYARPDRMIIAAPTHDDMTLIITYWPESQFHAVRDDVDTAFIQSLDMVPDLAQRVRTGKREEKFRGAAGLNGFFRKPYGPGWALVGDAGYHKNPITAEGITDAFRDAEFLVEAIDDAFSNRVPAEIAFATYEEKRNEAAFPIYKLTCDLATLGPPSPEMQAIFGALRKNPEQAGRFFGTMAGTVPLPEFFSPENMQRLMAG